MKEERLHKQICDYLKLHKDKPMFNTDMSGIKLPKGLAIKASKLRSNKGFPDIVIYEPRGGYFGLFLELKSEIPFKKDGQPKKNAHLEEQAAVIEKLKSKGYYARFIWRFEDAVSNIDAYLSMPKTPIL